MSSEEEVHNFGLRSNIPSYYNIPSEMMVNTPDHYIRFTEYRTSLGHKDNHKFDTVHHPVFGVCLIAFKDIEVDEELFVNYNYWLEGGCPVVS